MVSPLPTTKPIPPAMTPDTDPVRKYIGDDVGAYVPDFAIDAADALLETSRRAVTGAPVKAPSPATLSFPDNRHIKNEEDYNSFQDIYSTIDAIESGEEDGSIYDDDEHAFFKELQTERTLFEQQLARNQEQQAKDPGFWEAISKPSEPVPFWSLPKAPFETTRAIGKGVLKGGSSHCRAGKDHPQRRGCCY